MGNEPVAHQPRRMWRWSAIGVLFATAVPVLEHFAHSPVWVVRVTAGCAVVAWINLAIQTRFLRTVSKLWAG